MLQERVGSELHQEAISAQSEGKGRVRSRLHLKKWEIAASPCKPWIRMGKGGAPRREGCSLQRLLSRQNTEQGESWGAGSKNFLHCSETCMGRQGLEKGAQGPNAWLYRISPGILPSVRLDVIFPVPQACSIFLLSLWAFLTVLKCFACVLCIIVLTIMLIKKPQETCLTQILWWSHRSVLQENPTKQQNCYYSRK